MRATGERQEQKRTRQGGATPDPSGSALWEAPEPSVPAGMDRPAGSGFRALTAPLRDNLCQDTREMQNRAAERGLQKPNRVRRCVEMFALFSPFSLAGNNAQPELVPRILDQTE